MTDYVNICVIAPSSSSDASSEKWEKRLKLVGPPTRQRHLHHSEEVVIWWAKNPSLEAICFKSMTDDRKKHETDEKVKWGVLLFLKTNCICF